MTKARKPAQLTQEQAWGRSGLMALAAFRYCVGRMTYIVGDCANWLIENWNAIPEGTRACIQRDLEEEFQRDDAARERKDKHFPLGSDCDRTDWERVRALWKDQT